MADTLAASLPRDHSPADVAPRGRLRPIQAMPIAGLIPAKLGGVLPRFEWVEPQMLMVEEAYQRTLADRSARLIRRIIADWDWRRMKPPIVAIDAEGLLCVIDGQHTAIAAASHPGIEKIPIMIVTTAEVSDRAAAFIGHNRDRVAMTPMQMHYAALAAGDEIAVAVAEACKRANVTIRRSPPGNGLWQAGETVAAVSIARLVSHKGVPGAAHALKILVDAARTPIRSEEILAVASLLFEPEYKGQVNDFDLATAIRSKTYDGWISVAESTVRKGLKMPLWRAVAIAWYRAIPKRRAGAK